MNRRVDLVVNGESIAAQQRPSGDQSGARHDGRACFLQPTAAGAAGEQQRCEQLRSTLKRAMIERGGCIRLLPFFCT